MYLYRSQIGTNLTTGDQYCTCSFSTKELDVFFIQYLHSMYDAYVLV